MKVLYIDKSDEAVDRWLAQYGKAIADALSLELTDELKLSMDPGPAPRTGHVYPKPGTESTTYTASGPGENPAVREGILRDSFSAVDAVIAGKKVIAGSVSDLKTGDGKHFLAAVLNLGTTDGNIAPRPFIDYTLEVMADRHGGAVVAPEDG